MKIKVIEKPYLEVKKIPLPGHTDPKPQSAFFRQLLRILSVWDMRKIPFTYEIKGMEKVQGQPCLYLMNHSCFTDLEIATRLIGKHPFHIVCTSDGFVGKEKLMRLLGCIPTQKFVTDVSLVRDLIYILKTLHSSVLMYPEASYSFDGTATPLPEGLGKAVKLLGVPVVMIRTHGAFLHDPLYNELQLRKVPITAGMECIYTAEELKNTSAAEINRTLQERFSYNHFAEQQEKKLVVDEPFRADGLHRVLYQCPVCGGEGKMTGKGIGLTCGACGSKWTLDSYGRLVGEDKEIRQIPDWYAWERQELRKELEQEDYEIKLPVTIRILADCQAIYEVGKGTLTHSREGFTLTGCDGALSYSQGPMASYSLYADYFWYEIGDMVCIGDHSYLYYCFPEDPAFPVAKLRLAAEELYKMRKGEKRTRHGLTR